MQIVRDGGLIVAVLGLTLGFGLAAVATRPRRAFAAAIALPIVVAAVWSRPAVQVRAVSVVHRAATLHRGHIYTAGYTYKLLDPRLYEDRTSMDSMSREEALRFLVRSAVAYLVMPLPWSIESRAQLAYLPELVVWYVLVVLAAIGFLPALRRDAVVTSLLAASAVALMMLVAVTSGNIGTLIRHRSLALPYLVWLSAVGACEVVLRVGVRPASRVAAAPV